MLDSRIIAALQSKPWKVVQVLLFVSLSKLTLIAAPILLGHIVDGLTSGVGSSKHIPILLVAFCIAGLVQVFISPLQSLYLSRLVQDCVYESSLQWARNVMSKGFEVFSAMRIGGLINTVDRGVMAYEKLIGFLLTSGVPLFIETLIVGGVLFFYGGFLVFCTVLCTAIGYLVINHHIIRWRRNQIDDLNDQEDEVAASFVQTFTAAKAIKCEGAPESAFASLDGAYRGYALAAIKIGFSASILGSAKALFICLSTAGILLFGFIDQSSEVPFMTVGEMVAMFTIATAFFNNVASVAEAHRFTDQFSSDQKRFQQILNLQNFRPDRPVETKKISEAKTLTLQPLCIQRPEADLLQIVELLSINRGENIAIVGSSGSGKTTLLEALAGVLIESSTALKIEGTSINSLSSKDQFSLLRYCPQSPNIMNGPIVDSVLFGQPCDREELASCLNGLALPRLALELDNFEVENQGTNLSGGELKRLSLLRVIMRPGEFNLFDEPTASLDPVSAEQVWDFLFKRFEGCSLICVTHDLKVLGRFDRVLFVDGGKVLASGSWAELLNDETIFSALQVAEEIAAE
ncbi:MULTISPECIES: ABC transporter ATP-binding protein [unclassified Pseudomonas]|uniref:ATP-binding cassette domain-containing protein n=1 Tax=unclassified Pseudomonas TaxID=196821 RepID=UPI000DA7D9B4|nr:MULTISPECIES: ABC transporter ATP-binding protein [unclassified Pseudomonas]MDW3710607.1 ABC transporter ATP-binding protein [Pseudomonas sp. 2023EL-01195]PZE09362.1 ABC transporter [Pseudomonas sp. 57B-090624]